MTTPSEAAAAGEVADALATARALAAAGRLEEARVACQVLLDARPRDARALFALGGILRRLDRLDEAEACYRRILESSPEDARAWVNLGVVLRARGRTEDAAAAYREALAHDPGMPEIHFNLGNLLQAQGDLAGAVAGYRAAIRHRPDYADAHLNLAMALLLRGEYPEGWREYEWRWRSGAARALNRIREGFDQPRWDGAPLGGRTLLLQAEQGFGDALQMARFVPAAARGGRVLVECQPELRRLMARVPGVAGVVTREEPLPPFDLWCPLLSLPGVLGVTVESIPPPGEAVRPDPAKGEHWRGRFAALPGIKVGLVWAGAPEHRNDRNRSLRLADLGPLAGIEGISFVSLQKGPAAAGAASSPPGLALADFTAELADFDDTAALVSALDLVIAADTAVAHLAAALGRPTWILLPFAPDWRWLLGREDSPWYPSARLFRQSVPGDWSGVVARIAAAARARAAAGTPGAASLLEQGMTHHRAGDLAGAAACYREHLAGFPEDPDALNLLATVANQEGRFPEAEALARRAIAGRPDAADFHVSLGYALRQQGRLDGAVSEYREAVRLAPAHAEAWHKLGIALAALGRQDEAESAYRKALAHRPDFVEAIVSLGVLAHRRGRFEEAVARFREAIALRPEAAEPHAHLGSALSARGDRAAAESTLRRALELRPGFPEAWNSLATVLQGLGRLDEALAAYDEALRLRSAYPEACLNRGLALQAAGRLDEAEAGIREALALRPGYPEAHMALGTVEQARGHFEPAAQHYRDAIAARPGYAEAHSNLGVVLQELGRLDEALAEQEHAVLLDPAQPEILCNLGVVLKERGRYAEAVERYREALRLRPDHPDAWINLGAALNELGRLDEAFEAYESAVRARPDHAEAHWNLALALLMRGDFERGWREYEWRWDSETARRAKVTRPSFPQPMWRGEPVAGKRLLLLAEQGFGDAIQFVRYAALMARQGATVFVECPREVASLLAAAEGVAGVVARGDPPPDFDYWCPFLSLPHFLGTTVDTVPAEMPALRADPAKVVRWRERLASWPGLKVGLAWAGRPEHRNDRNRSIALDRLALLGQATGVSFHSLQKGPPAAQAQRPPAGMALVDWQAELTDFTETAALIECLDLVIAVDTAVAHLAGALARPVWVMLPFTPDWRWLLEREDSPWYPSMRLFRQTRPDDWDPVVDRVAAALGERSSASPRVDPPPLAEAIARHRAGRLDEAAAGYRAVLAARPDDPDATQLLGVIATQQGRHGEAAGLIRRAIGLRPTVPEYHNNLGNVLRELGETEAAEAAYREALRLNPGFAEGHNNLGLILKLRGELDGAVAAYGEALRLKPDYAEALVNLGNARQAQGRMDEAVESYRRALELRPGYPEAWMNLGNALQRMGRLGEAEARTREALRLKPDYPDAHMNLGHALQSQGRVADALACYREALRLRPDFVEAHWNLALALLLAGDYAEGWREYEWRWRWKEFPSARRGFDRPQWRGEDPAGRTLLLHAEQVFGDAIQFGRYIPRVVATGARVVVECQPGLTELFRASFPGVARWVAQGEPLPAFDLHCPFLSLPLAFGTTLETVPAEVPYLKPDPARVARWAERLAGEPGLKVGLVWAGSPQHRNDRNRSIPLARLAPLASVPGVTWVSLQKGPAAAEAASPPPGMRLLDFGAELRDFSDTAALAANLDLVIAVDTSVVHLAGALGRPAWAMIAAAPDWRWMLDRADSPWYPTLRLFRQPAWGDWASVVAAVAAALRERLGLPAPAQPSRLAEAVRLHQAGDAAGAEALYRAVLAADPGCLDALHLLGVAARQQKRLEEAADFIGRALAGRPEAAEFHASLGNVHKDAGRLEQACASYREAVRLKPAYAEAWYNLGGARLAQGRPAEAEAAYRQSVVHNPAFPEAWYNLGNTLLDLDRAEAAEEAYRAALSRRPNYAEAHSNLGSTLITLARPREAIECFRQAIALRVDYPDAHWNLALALLMLGEFDEGWREYEWRWRTDAGRSLERQLPKPRWRGENPAGKRILLHGEQGLGDAIQFVRYAPLLAARGATVLLDLRPELDRVCASVEGVAGITRTGDPLPEFDLHCPLLSLPLAFGTGARNIPADVPYLAAEDRLVEAWRERLGESRGPRIGIAWAGRREYPNDRRRSIPLARFAPLAAAPGIRFISLQKGEAASEAREGPGGLAVDDWSDGLGDLADTAALITALDLVISVDTAVAHLAGALGKPAWTLLPLVPDWRWQLGREDSPWYPSMRLFRQVRAGDWDEVMVRVAAAIAATYTDTYKMPMRD